MRVTVLTAALALSSGAFQGPDGLDQVEKGGKTLTPLAQNNVAHHQLFRFPPDYTFPVTLLGRTPCSQGLFSPLLGASSDDVTGRKPCRRSCWSLHVATSKFCTRSQNGLANLDGKLVGWQLASGTGFTERPSHEMFQWWPSCLAIGEVLSLGDLSWSLSNHADRQTTAQVRCVPGDSEQASPGPC